MMDRMDREIIFAKVYNYPKTRKSILKFALHVLHRDGKIFKTTAVSYLIAFSNFFLSQRRHKK